MREVCSTETLHRQPFLLAHNKVPYLLPGGELINRFLGLKKNQEPLASQMWISSTVECSLPGVDAGLSRLSMRHGGDCFRDLLRQNPAKFLGPTHAERWGSSTGTLLKLLHNTQRLLVQVHPDREMAMRLFGSPCGKTEVWYVLDQSNTDTASYIHAGFRPGVTREQFGRLILKQDTEAILKCLHRFEVSRGNIIFIPPGLPHALGADILVAELQEPCDITLRAERIRPDGTLLPWDSLHSGIGMEALLDCFAFDCLDREQQRRRIFLTPEPAGQGETVLVSAAVTHCFAMSELKSDRSLLRENRHFLTGLVLEGTGWLLSEDTALPLARGSEFFIPYGVSSYRYDGDMRVLECYPPQ